MRTVPRLLLALLFSSSAACTQATDAVDQQSENQTADAGHGDGAAAAADATADGGAEADGGASSFVDPRDGKTYRTLRFGDATWLGQNLDHAMPGAYCYDDDPASCERDGRLYTFTAARTACPLGWHLPSDAEWKALETAVGMRADQLDVEGYATPRGTREGTILKRKDGFAATMAGFRSGTEYDARDDRTYLWTSSTRGGEVWRRRIAGADPYVYRFTNPPASFAISVRCVAD